MTRAEDSWHRQEKKWRDPSMVAGLFAASPDLLSHALRYRVRGPFWELLSAAKVTLLVTREYEHLALALCVVDDSPAISYMPVPHPSGLVYDRRRRRVHLASTRNPNMILQLEPVTGLSAREDVKTTRIERHPLVPRSVRFYPGSTYLHDLALIDGELHANAVGENAVVRVADDGSLERVFWPRAIDGPEGPRFGVNYLQLNSIASAKTVDASFFTASAAQISSRRPGQLSFPVNRRGVVFSGKTREPIAFGLTRPHSARLHRRRLWVANSGYGELGIVRRGAFEPVVRLPGWTRGLAFVGDIAFAGTSRVLPRFHRYAPGLDPKRSKCGVHAIDVRTGEVLASLTWPAGNQIFAIDSAPSTHVSGFAFTGRHPATSAAARDLFYAFSSGD